MTLKVLILERSADRLTRIEEELSRGPWSTDITTITECRELPPAISAGPWNAIIVEGGLCGEALEMLRRSGRHFPLFVVAHDDAEEDLLRRMLREGARDVISVSRLGRMNPSIERELREASSEGERSAIAHELAERQRYYAAILENVREVILTLDRDGTIRYGNPWAEKVLEKGGPLVGRPALSLCHPDDQDLFFDAMEHDSETRVRLRGQNQWRLYVASFRHFASPLSGEHVVMTARDLTDRVALETKLEQARRINSLGRLAATVAHEFNNVLMGIQPSVDLLRHGDNPAQEAAVGRIDRSIRRGRRISSEILRYAQPSRAQPQPVDLVWHLQEYEPEARQLVGDRGRFVLEIAAGTPPVLVDPEQFTQVITNLVQNAADALRPEGGSVYLRAEALDKSTSTDAPVLPEPWRYIHLTVSDDGVGIPAEILPNVFEPLFTTKKGGTGLGLPVVHQIVTSSGGLVNVRSRPGEGTTFHLCLPRALGAVERKVDELSHTIQRAETGVKRIVFVEDDELVAEGVIALLDEEGFEVTHVALGEEAIAAIQRTAPDAVVLDLGLPDIPGDEVFRRIRLEWNELPVIFSTGHGDRAALLNEKDPAVRYLPKPWQVEQLLQALATLDLERWHSAREREQEDSSEAELHEEKPASSSD